VKPTNTRNKDDKPVYDSSEGPIKKGGKIAKAKADVFISGESFGGRYPVVKGSQKDSGKDKLAIKRETIGENFLEEEDDASSGLAESGEIDPRLFR
jgi:hypothetical protein